MAFWDLATDVRIFVVTGIILAMLIGSVGPMAAELSIVVLILQMAASLHGLKIRKDDFKTDLKPALFSIVCCFVISTASALLMGLFFINSNQAVWYGWVMLASVPSAVSIITIALMMKGNMPMAMISMVLVYLIAFALTPFMTHMLIGSAISPMEILKYVVLFIAVPVLLNLPLSRFRIERKYKVMFINCMMCLLIVIAFGKCRECLLDNLGLIGIIIVMCAIRTFGVGSVFMYLLRKKGVPRENIVIYTGFCVWKNSGLGSSMCLLLLAAYPEAALVCTTSLVMESIWFAVTNKSLATYWPADIYPEETKEFPKSTD